MLGRVVLNHGGRQPSAPRDDHLCGHQTLSDIKRFDIEAAYLQEEANGGILLWHFGRHMSYCQTCQLIIPEGGKGWEQAWGGG